MEIQKENTRLLIHGGWPAHGEVTLTGDTYSAIVKICIACLNGGETVIENVPRSKLLLNFLNFAISIGVGAKWVNVDALLINADWSSISNDISKKDLTDLHIYEVFLCIVLAKKFSVKVSLATRKRLLRYKKLGFQMEYSEDNYYLITCPLEFPSQRVNVNCRQRDFFTTLSYAIIKNLYTMVNINFENNYSPIRDVLGYSAVNSKKLIVDANRFELSFYASLALLTDGEITIKNADLSKSLGFLLDLREIGLDYDVKKNTVRVWQEQRVQKDFYNYYTSEVDELGYLLIIHSVIGSKKIKLIGYNSYGHREMLKNLNIMGCKIDYEEFGNKLYISISPSILRTSRSFLDESGLAGVVIFASLVYQGNSIINNIDKIEHVLPDISDNLSSLKLKYSLS